MPPIPNRHKKGTPQESRKDTPTSPVQSAPSLSDRLKQSLPSNSEYAPIPTKEEVDKFGWVKKTVRIAWIKSGKDLTKRAEGEVLSGIAIYPTLYDVGQNRWTVGCATNGLRMLDVDTKDDARRIGELLFKKCCLAFKEKTQKAILEKLPSWVRPWIIACRKKLKFIEPEKWVTESEESEG